MVWISEIGGTTETCTSTQANCTSLPHPSLVWQVTLGPVWAGDGTGLREAVQALPSTVASLALLPSLQAEREGGEGGAWRLQLFPNSMYFRLLQPGRRSDVRAVLELCAAFDRPGLASGLVGQVGLAIEEPPAGAGPGALGAYLGQCAEVAGRLRGGGTGGLPLELHVRDAAVAAGQEAAGGAVAAGGDDGGGFLGRVLGAVLPAAAPHVWRLQLLPASGRYTPNFSRHLAAPGLAFPLLEALDLMGSDLWASSMAAADMTALALLAAPRLSSIGLLSPTFYDGAPGGAILGEVATCCAGFAVTALALTRPRPVDAAGRPAALKICVGFVPSASAEQAVAEVLAWTGREWVTVEWPTIDGSADGDTDA